MLQLKDHIVNNEYVDPIMMEFGEFKGDDLNGVLTIRIPDSLYYNDGSEILITKNQIKQIIDYLQEQLNKLNTEI